MNKIWRIEGKDMEFQELIEARRSIRKYDATRRVTKEQMLQIVQAAIEAPSWKNMQTSRYYCILSEELCEKFMEDCLPKYNAENAQNSALVVTTFISNQVGFNRHTGLPDNECGNGWGYYDLGLHNENFILKAKELGLDTLIMGLRDADKIRTMLNIPEEETIVSVISVGYAAGESPKPKRKTPEEIIKFF